VLGTVWGPDRKPSPDLTYAEIGEVGGLTKYWEPIEIQDSGKLPGDGDYADDGFSSLVLDISGA
jgi:hypothetical protein